MQTTREIREALEVAILEAGNVAALAKRTGIRHSTLGRIQHGDTQAISDRTWTRLRPLLALPEDHCAEKPSAYGTRISARAMAWAERYDLLPAAAQDDLDTRLTEHLAAALRSAAQERTPHPTPTPPTAPPRSPPTP